MILLDEPSFGLDRAEVRRLGSVLDKLSRDGNTVIVIEHNHELIAGAGWIVELGPAAGQAGGTLIAAGTAPEIRANRQSLIAKFL